ncbi:Golgi apyrase [Boothiomyces macroporosus]|uniref:Golgi apyrase n=1 Tax=Boothiomyces macroporosus TaxID=261099 RepID=A0AAD5Y4D4_9FUNG|nr:Golgi apyrase [Boothiomyces macroporosus]
MYPLRRTNSSQFKRKKSIIPVIYQENSKSGRSMWYALLAVVFLVFLSIVFWSKSSIEDIIPDSFSEHNLYSLNIPSIKDIPHVATDKRYCIVIDAGSSGSRIYVYSWNSPSLSQSKQVIDINKPSENSFEKKIRPGISSLASAPEQVSAYLQPLLEFAEKTVPAELHSSTPIFLYATAGLRLLDKELRDSLLSNACLYTLQNFKFAVDSCTNNFRMISGEMEGMLGWIAVNYLQHKFQDKSIGFMDMGGASTQIAFEPVTNSHKNDLIDIFIRYQDGSQAIHKVFVTSFLGYGVNQARMKYVKSLLDNATTEYRNTTDPCLPVGLQVRTKVNITGSGSFEKCYSAITPILEKSQECSKDPCPLNGIHVPLTDFHIGKFFGISEFWYTTSNGFDLGGVYRPEAVFAALQKHCSYTWEELENKFYAKEFKNIDNLSRLELQCFKGVYILNLLHEGFGFPKSSLKDGQDFDLKTVDEISGFSVSWTFGMAFIYASSTIMLGRTSYAWEYIYITGLLAILAFMVYKYWHGRKHAVVDMSKYHTTNQSSIHIEVA